jgi:geranylgeranyl diphosphate synthase type I
MLAYHLGWEGEGAGSTARGKRIRPLLVLLTTEAAGGNWENALPAAAGVELVHNFSLIHDDIQDNSPLRRGRKTVWKKWGIAQAINAGDSMFSLAHLALKRLPELCPPHVALKASQILPEACLTLTQGQFLDLSYEQRTDLTTEDYWPMISGKTAALLSTCTQLGALIAEADQTTQEAYHSFGKHIGLSFQVQDDILGIWGDAAHTGKSAASDLLSGKKSLPVLFGLAQNGNFAQRWIRGPLLSEEITAMADQLEQEGALEFSRQTADSLTQKALNALKTANPQDPAKQALYELTDKLTKRIA